MPLAPRLVVDIVDVCAVFLNQIWTVDKSI